MITERVAFDKIASKLNSAAFRTHRIPQQVFCEGYGEFACIEFDIFSGDHFWGFLQRLARAVGDNSISCAVIDPDPTDYFFKEFGVYGAIELDRTASGDQYFAALSSGSEISPADSLLHNSEVVTWFSPSLEWFIWGERSLTIAIVGLRKSVAVPMSSLAADSGVRLFSPEEALSQFICSNFTNDRIPVGWRELFLQNYSETPAS